MKDFMSSMKNEINILFEVMQEHYPILEKSRYLLAEVSGAHVSRQLNKYSQYKANARIPSLPSPKDWT